MLFQREIYIKYDSVEKLDLTPDSFRIVPVLQNMSFALSCRLAFSDNL